MTNKPDIDMPNGQAWEYDLEKMGQFNKLDGEHGTISLWLVKAAWAHPWWHSYIISTIHLRPIAELPPPRMYLPDATHEILVEALTPDWKYEDLLELPHRHALQPANFAAQWKATGDEGAKMYVRETVELICKGELSPDTDFISLWVERFNDSMMRK